MIARRGGAQSVEKAERRPYPLRVKLSGREYFLCAEHEAVSAGGFIQCPNNNEPLLSE